MFVILIQVLCNIMHGRMLMINRYWTFSKRRYIIVDKCDKDRQNLYSLLIIIHRIQVLCRREGWNTKEKSDTENGLDEKESIITNGERPSTNLWIDKRIRERIIVTRKGFYGVYGRTFCGQFFIRTHLVCSLKYMPLEKYKSWFWKKKHL